MMKKQLITAAFGVIAYCGLTLSAYAASIEGNSSCVFENAQGGASLVQSGASTASFSWGSGVNSAPSSLYCAGQIFDTDTGVFFDIVDLMNGVHGNLYSTEL
jgi:hypothetical protein